MGDATKELVVCIFDGEKKADEAQKAIRELDKRLEVVKLGHIAVIHKNSEGKVTISETGDPGHQWGRWSIAAGAAVALASAATGGAILIPALLGGGAAAVATQFIDTGFPDSSLREIGNGLDRNQSALVTIVDNPEEREIVESELQELGGELIQGSLSEAMITKLGAATAAAVPLSEDELAQDEAAEGQSAGAIATAAVAAGAAAAAAGEEGAASEGEAAPGGGAAGLAAAAVVAAAAQETPAEPDNLREIPDIGPVYERLLQMHGVRTFADLAAMRPDELQRLFSGHDPVSGYPVITASMEEAQAMIELAGLRAQGKSPDNLREIPNVGPVYERMLMRRGVIHYAQIAAMRPEELQSVFTGYDPETNQLVMPLGLDEAGLMIMDAQRLAAAAEG
ncbi:MAG: DUF1269 domain-containing protein [Anaerolineae bacterium]